MPSVPRGTIELGLERMQQLLCLLEHPKQPIQVIHVAGTNGKGSTCAFMALALDDHDVGRFNSPCLIEPSDAWRVGDRQATSQDYGRYLEHVMIKWREGTHSGELTEFEAEFGACVCWFRDNAVIRAIVEVGVGGRRDATNLTDTPCLADCKFQQAWLQLEAAVITNIALDHQSLLGSTIEVIAQEKAGIMRKNKPCFIGKQSDPRALKQLVQDAIQVDCINETVVLVDVVNDVLGVHISFVEGNASLAVQSLDSHLQELTVPWKRSSECLKGYQLENAALAALVLFKHYDMQPLDIAHRLDQNGGCIWPGRLDTSVRLPLLDKPAQILLDGAHNLDGALKLRKYLDSEACSSITWILGMSENKDHQAMLRALLRPNDRIVLVGFSTPANMPWVRCVLPADLCAFVPTECDIVGMADRVWDVQTDWFPGPPSQNLDAVVAGSLYLVSDVYRWVKGKLDHVQ